jgi:hypothetical protein
MATMKQGTKQQQQSHSRLAATLGILLKAKDLGMTDEAVAKRLVKLFPDMGRPFPDGRAKGREGIWRTQTQLYLLRKAGAVRKGDDGKWIALPPIHAA